MAVEVKIVTDSTAYLEPEIIQKYDIRVIPIKVAFGDKVYSEGVNITNDEFYKKIAGGNVFSTTSQPPIGDFIKVYSELTRKGHPVLSIHISSKMSGTVNSARTARDMVSKANIEIIDTTTLAMGMLIVPAAEEAKRGKSLPEIKASIEKLNNSISSIGLLDTLTYAWRGGRIGAARALLGTLLRIKPVLTFEEGEVKILARPRTISGALEHIVEFVEKRAGDKTLLHGWVAHAGSYKVAAMLERELRAHFNWAELRLFELGPTFGTHMGPGFTGMGFYTEKDWKPG